ncbi:hypothetical protein FGO68_gene3256 [Halteria grandinella]|uniref:Uncharacterized protein n=1 Tax=Halteria grandinella TaxID=5974 RepID=A0A8J8NPM0_HALGN|nr:hypothetical protein FGO68_gene3256 [Halteria grandinella]
MVPNLNTDRSRQVDQQYLNALPSRLGGGTDRTLSLPLNPLSQSAPQHPLHLANQLKSYMKATVNLLDSQGRIPPEAYFPQANTRELQEHNSRYLQSMDKRLDQNVHLKQSYEADKVKRESEIYDAMNNRLNHHQGRGAGHGILSMGGARQIIG